MRECCRQVEAEVVSESKNKIHQTWGPPISGALYLFSLSRQNAQFAVFLHIRRDLGLGIAEIEGLFVCLKVACLRQSLKKYDLSIPRVLLDKTLSGV